jgi:hypothetical protein
MTAQLATGDQPITTTDLLPYEEPKKPKKGDLYFPDGYYSMHSDLANMRGGSFRALPVAMRIWFMAAARANVYGHAPFAPRELEKLLGDVSKPRRLAAIRSLKSSQMIAPESTSLCIVLNSEWIRRADRSYKTCIEPSHLERQNLMWTHSYGWESGQYEWHAFVNDPARILEVKRTRTRTRGKLTFEFDTDTDDRSVVVASAPEWHPGLCKYITHAPGEDVRVVPGRDVCKLHAQPLAA